MKKQHALKVKRKLKIQIMVRIPRLEKKVTDKTANGQLDTDWGAMAADFLSNAAQPHKK